MVEPDVSTYLQAPSVGQVPLDHNSLFIFSFFLFLVATNDFSFLLPSFTHLAKQCFVV